MHAPLRITGRGDWLSLIPYLLRFPPRESLVWLWLREDQLVLTARSDLDDAGSPMMAGFVAGMASRTGGRPVIAALSLVLSRAEAGLRAAEDACREQGVEPLDLIAADDTSWTSPRCGHRCPPTGHPRGESDSPAAAEMVLEGVAPWASREEAVASVRPPEPGEGVVAAYEAEDRASRRRRVVTKCRTLQKLLLAFLAEPRELDEEECRTAAVLAMDVAVRDIAWSVQNRVVADVLVDFWTQVVRRAPSPWAVGALCQLGIAAWLAGSGAITTECLVRAEELDAEGGHVGLLKDVVEMMTPPELWEQAMASAEWRSLGLPA